MGTLSSRELLSLGRPCTKYHLVTKNIRTKAYSLGPAPMPLARKAREKIDISAIAKNHLQRLAHRANAGVFIIPKAPSQACPKKSWTRDQDA